MRQTGTTRNLQYITIGDDDGILQNLIPVPVSAVRGCILKRQERIRHHVIKLVQSLQRITLNTGPTWQLRNSPPEAERTLLKGLTTRPAYSVEDNITDA